MRVRMEMQKGFTLIEILIAVLVFSIGLLGVAKLQTVGVKATHSAHLRTQATLASLTLADRVRANRSAYVDATTGHFVHPPTGTTAKNCEWSENNVEDCTVTEMAQFDLKKWRDDLADNFPGGTGTLCIDSTPNDGEDDNGNGVVEESEYACDGTGSVYAIKVWWVDEYATDGDPVIKRFVTTFQP